MQTFDKLGDHASYCEKNGDRHNRVRNLLLSFVTKAFLLPLSNFGTFFRTLDWSGGRPLAVDVAVTSPFSVFGLRSSKPADAYGDLHKHTRYHKLFRGKSVLFAALVLETTGGLSQEATSLLKAVFRFGSRRQNIQHCVYAGRAWARLSCNLQTSVAQAILCRTDGWVQQPHRSQVRFEFFFFLVLLFLSVLLPRKRQILFLLLAQSLLLALPFLLIQTQRRSHR